METTELIAAATSVLAGAIALLVRKYVPLDTIAGWFRKASDIAEDVVEEVDETVDELSVILAEQREAYEFLRGRFDELKAEYDAAVDKLADEEIVVAILNDALATAAERIAELSDPNPER